MLRARRLEAAALGLGGLARIAVGEDVGLRGSDSTEERRTLNVVTETTAMAPREHRTTSNV